jgi:hypothetical protein
MRTVYPLVIAPAWAVLHGVGAYRLALAINALLMTAVVLPAFGIVRHLVSFRWALATAACAAVVPGMVWAGMLMTEAVAYPVAGMALFAMVTALRRPGILLTVAVGVGILAGYLVRTQLIVLAAVFALTVVIDIAVGGQRELRHRVHRHRAVLGGALLAAVGLGVLLLHAQRSLGTYACVVASPPSPREIAGPLTHYLGILAVAALGLPAIAFLALALQRASWRDARLQPVLCVALAAMVVFVGQAAWAAVTVSPELQERYVFYAAPVLVACLPALSGRVRPRIVAAVGAVVVVYAATLFPGFADVTGDVVAKRLGLMGLPADVLGNTHVLWGAVFAVLTAAGVLATHLGGTRGVAVAVGVAAAFGAGVFGVRQLDANQASTELAQRSIQPRDIADRVSGGEPVGVVMTRNANATSLFNLQLWNRSVDRAYRIGIADAFGSGQLCPMHVARDGTLSLVSACAGRPLPHVLAILNGRRPLRFRNANVVFAQRDLQIVRFAPDAAPQLRLTSAAEARQLEPPPDFRRPSGSLDRCNA